LANRKRYYLRGFVERRENEGGTEIRGAIEMWVPYRFIREKTKRKKN